MTKYLYILIFQVFFTAGAFGQVDWEKNEDNPILELGPAGSWDSHGIDMGSVVFDGNIYHLWYGGSNGSSYRIGHATSPDGITWTKDSLNPVLDTGPSGSWDDSFVYLPSVLLNGTIFHMWYDGNGGSYEQIGHATSEDGSTWVKDPLNPVLEVGPPGSWDASEAFPLTGSVIFEEDIYKIWYGGINYDTYKYCIGYATSEDGSVWIKDTVNNPVIQAGPSSSWDGSHVVPGSVLNDGSVYRMWYSGSGDNFGYQIGLATSPDGIVWTKDTANPVLQPGPEGSWDDFKVLGASVIWNESDGRYMMWYSSGDWFYGRIGFASSLAVGINVPNFKIQNSKFKVQNYPNPTRGIVNLQFTLYNLQSVYVSIYDLQGREVAIVLDEKMPEGEHNIKYDLSGWPDGMYLVKVTAGKATSTEKLLKIN